MIIFMACLSRFGRCLFSVSVPVSETKKEDAQAVEDAKAIQFFAMPFCCIPFGGQVGRDKTVGDYVVAHIINGRGKGSGSPAFRVVLAEHLAKLLEVGDGPWQLEP